jgi:hypothetical protein
MIRSGSSHSIGDQEYPKLQGVDADFSVVILLTWIRAAYQHLFSVDVSPFHILHGGLLGASKGF